MQHWKFYFDNVLVFCNQILLLSVGNLEYCLDNLIAHYKDFHFMFLAIFV